MVIVYNPKKGAPIKGFICEKESWAPHYPDGYETPDGKISNGLIQYSDSVAKEILDRYAFLEQITPAAAAELIARPKAEFSCDFPNCEFKTHTKVALSGHNRKHAADRKILENPIFDESAIPIAASKRVLSLAEQKKKTDNKDILSGPDADGVEWYGEGVKVERATNPSLESLPDQGQGHFIG